MSLDLLMKFLKLEAAGGIVLFLAAIMAMMIANSPLAFLHQQFINQSLFVINDGLMAVFFLVVGLELKRHYREGKLSGRQSVLPLAAAAGGMLVPAGIYCFVNAAHPELLKGWATPVATDIAFVMGVLSLIDKRVPFSIKLFILSLAIFDDIGAILIIAICYTVGISPSYLCAAVGIAGLMLVLRTCFEASELVLLLVWSGLGVLLWLTLWVAGIHPTIAGVVLAMLLPDELGQKLEKWLHPWVVFGVMPLFAFANAGFSFQDINADHLVSGVVLGIVLGLFMGKQIGVFVFSWLFIKARFADLPAESSWRHLYGAALLCGIGFTMSLFLGTLSFAAQPQYLSDVRLGVLSGSILSALAGAFIFSSDSLRRAGR